MKLQIALPALNEELSIASTIDAALAARAEIVAGGVVSEAVVTVVSDGSTDRTVEIARSYGDRISLIVFPENRGYGAAIQEAWRRSDAELLGFMDADGTCDPRFFRQLCAALAEERADVVLGSRLAADSRMQRVRRLGNRLFGWLLSAVARTSTSDTASGMRVVRRSRVADLLPLPAGMSFTPAMSARALLAGDLKLVEVPMPYADRIGDSKLRPFRDGVRILAAIFDTTLLYRPARLLEPPGILAGIGALALMAGPLRHYAFHRQLEEWMIHRFLASQLLATVGLLLVTASYLATRIAGLTLRRAPAFSTIGRLLARLVRGRGAWLTAVALVGAGLALTGRGLVELLATGAMREHWSRFVVASFLAQTAAMVLVLKWIGHGLDLIAAEHRADRTDW